MKEIIFVLDDDPDGGYSARALGFSIFVQGETIEELKANIKDALKCHFEKDEDIPRVIRLHQVKEDIFSYA
jgi:predicted RNase H-like HicB family nuclease